MDYEDEGGEEGEEEQTFLSITNQINTVAEKFEKTPEEVMIYFQQASCNFATLEEFLQTSNKELLWNPLEDYALKLDENSVEYQYLLSIKGQEKIDERIKFLESE